MSVREADDGRALLHAFCGCSAEAVLAALGLQLRDLFDAPLGHHVTPMHSRVPARELLEVLDHETQVACLILADVLEARAADESQWHRLALAAARIGQARDHANPAERSHAKL